MKRKSETIQITRWISAILLCCIILTSCGKTESDIQKNEIKDEYNFSYNFNNNFTSGDSINESGDFIYLSPISGGLFEYDTVEDKTVELPAIPYEDGALRGASIQGSQLYDGQIFTTVWYQINEGGGDNSTKFMLINPNTGEARQIYSVEEKYGAQSAVISDNGIIFYVANLYGDNNSSDPPEHIDENGYDISCSLVRYDTNSKEKTTLVDGVFNYFLKGDRIYFDRVNNNNSVHLYYTTYEDAENGKKPVDTGIDVGKHYLGYMWTVKEDVIYYADDSGSLFSYDTQTSETSVVFSSKYSIRTFDFFGNKIIFSSRYKDENGIYRSQISMYDMKSKVETNISTEALAEDEDYDEKTSENPSNFIVSENLDYFIMETHQISGGCGSKYYKVYEDGTREEFFESGWDTEAE